MIHIQEIAAQLVIDPQTSGISCGTDTDHIPHFVEPLYPYPGTIRNLLPLSTKDGGPTYDDSHWKNVEDLKLPKQVKEDPFYFYWDPFGDPLSEYKKYEHFQIGNFDYEDEQFPQAIAIQKNSSPLLGYVNRKAKDGENAISGIAFRYSDPLSALHDGLRNDVLSDGKTGSAPYTVCGGRHPGDEKGWVTLPDPLNMAPFNQVCVYYKQGTRRISGLEFLSEEEPDRDGVGGHTDVVILYHKEWEGRAKNKNVDPSPAAEPFLCTPGDGLPGSTEKNWMFAGLVGAFERVGPFKRDRVLAKIAIIWKRKASVLALDT
jgi:hypothetical protein